MSALFDFSQALAAVVATAAGRVVRVQDKGRNLSGILWREGLVVTAEECLSGDDGVTVTLPDGTLAEKGRVGRGYLGLAMQPLRGGVPGLIVVEVAEGGPAGAAGFLIGDVVTTWQGER